MQKQQLVQQQEPDSHQALGQGLVQRLGVACLREQTQQQGQWLGLLWMLMGLVQGQVLGLLLAVSCLRGRMLQQGR